MKNFLLVVVCCLGLTQVAVSAQDIQTKGSISGTVVDFNGAVLQNAKGYRHRREDRQPGLNH